MRDLGKPATTEADEAHRRRSQRTPGSSALGYADGSAPPRHTNRVAMLQRFAGNQATAHYLQRHPSHAEEEEVLRKPDPTAALIQRESKKKRKARMESKYGITLTGDLPESMLKKIDDILKLLPRSHTKGNDALKEITGGGGIGGNASAYDSTNERLEINTPELPGGSKMPTWLYLLLSKGMKLQRDLMDAGAMADFDIDAAKDTELGLDNKGKRQVMAGVSDVLATGNLVSWTLRHETGHAVDQKIKFTSARAKLPQFGGWRTYDEQKPAEMKELATAFLLKAGFSAGQLDIPTKDTPIRTLRELLSERIASGELGIRPTWLHPFARVLGLTKPEVEQLFDALAKSMEIATAHPWTFSDGGGDLVKVGERMYHRDHYGTWVSYLAAERATALSNYQFSSPGEWFAEAYAAVYDSDKKSPARARLAAPARDWFISNLGPPSSNEKQAATSSGKLADTSGNLQTLTDLDDAVFAALSNPRTAVTVKPSDLPADLQ